MASGNVRGDDERQGLSRSLRTQMGYGTAPSSAATKKSIPITRKFISRKVQRTDTLMGISLKYGVPVGELKKENKLWNPDHLFLREQLLIPLTPENENALDETDTIVVYSGSTAVSPSSPHPVLPNGSVPSTSYHVSSETEPVKASSKSQPNGSSSIPDSKKGGNPDDFFNKYDNSIARLKGDVAKMEKNAAAGLSVASQVRLSTSSARSSTSSYQLAHDDYVETETVC